MREEKNEGESSNKDVNAVPEEKNEGEGQPYRVRLPGFVSDEDVGLGDAIKRMTYALGIQPCAGCERRAAALNRWFVFAGRAK